MLSSPRQPQGVSATWNRAAERIFGFSTDAAEEKYSTSSSLIASARLTRRQIDSPTDFSMSSSANACRPSFQSAQFLG